MLIQLHPHSFQKAGQHFEGGSPNALTLLHRDGQVDGGAELRTSNDYAPCDVVPTRKHQKPEVKGQKAQGR